MSTPEDVDLEGGIGVPSMLPALYAALSKAQGEFPPIPRDRTVKVQTKTGGSYTFAYAPLETIIDKTRPALTGNGLAFTQTFRAGVLVTALLHADGGRIESEFPVQFAGQWQEFGSALTYARRYALIAILGVATEEDDDGNHAAGNVAAPQQRTAPAPASRGRGNVTDKQLGLIHGLMDEIAQETGVDREELTTFAAKEFNVENLGQLTGGRDGDASRLISRLQSKLILHYLGTLDADKASQAMYEASGGATELSEVAQDKLGDVLKALKAINAAVAEPNL
jgi:hypothetical protein